MPADPPAATARPAPPDPGPADPGPADPGPADTSPASSLPASSLPASSRPASSRPAGSGPAARPGPADLIAAALAALEPLAARLRADGWRTGLQAPPGHLPVLEVANPGMPMLADTITARPDGDGQWWLWWSWAQRIAPAADLDLATAVTTKVLGGP